MISSKTNPQFKRWCSLLETSGIKEYNQFLVFGEKVVNEVLKTTQSIDEIIVPKGFQVPKHFLKYPNTEIEKILFSEIDLFKTKYPILVCKALSIKDWNPSLPPQGLELICPVGDPRNLGAIVRSAVAFDVSKIILLKNAANPMLPQAVRASSGGIFQMEFCRGPLLKDLEDTSDLMALDFGGVSVPKVRWPKNLRLVVGEEGPGLRDRKFRQTAYIPISSKIESLNAAMATSIALFCYFSQNQNPD